MTKKKKKTPPASYLSGSLFEFFFLKSTRSGMTRVYCLISSVMDTTGAKVGQFVCFRLEQWACSYSAWPCRLPQQGRYEIILPPAIHTGSGTQWLQKNPPVPGRCFSGRPGLEYCTEVVVPGSDLDLQSGSGKVRRDGRSASSPCGVKTYSSGKGRASFQVIALTPSHWSANVVD